VAGSVECEGKGLVGGSTKGLNMGFCLTSLAWEELTKTPKTINKPLVICCRP